MAEEIKKQLLINFEKSFQLGRIDGVLDFMNWLLNKDLSQDMKIELVEKFRQYKELKK